MAIKLNITYDGTTKPWKKAARKRLRWRMKNKEKAVM